MPIASGTRIGHYQVTGSLGAGGMGEVYRARDTKLDRDVALKILPDAFAADAERRARFVREAKTLAALNHTHIAQIYGVELGQVGRVGQVGEVGEERPYLVMELVEGEDLSQRLKRGPFAYDEAIALAKQIALALEAAHEHGIIHRDLKPANIKLRDDGTVKVLDFGLAKLATGLSTGAPAGAKVDGSGGEELLNSPTITSPAMTRLRQGYGEAGTEIGMILGTAAYMAPEQAKGRAVDKRADIWAFGCVLYEMLTGRRAFPGDDVSDTLAAVLRADVDLTVVPASVRRLLAKCLEKDHRKRLHDIGDAWELIDDRPSSPAVVARTPWLAWGVAAVFLASTVALAVLHFTETPPQPAGARFQIAPPEKTRFDIYLSLSPDGRRLAFTAGEPGAAVHLWVRDLESLEARRLPGTEGAASPFWSPDSRYIGFAEGARLKKIDLAGGQPQIIAESPAMVGVGAWGRDGVIVFGSRGGLGGIRRVADTGGDPVEVTTVAGEAGESLHSFPFFLPDGRRFLYFCASGRPEVQGIYVGSIDGSAAPRAPRLVAATMGPVIIAAEGQAPKLFFVRDGTLLAQSFDANRVQLSGTPTPVAERLGNIGSFAFFSVAANVLTFRTGTSTGNNLSQLTWLGRKGEPLGTLGEPRQLTQNPDGLVISPDGRQAAIVVGPVPSDVWVVEFARGIATRATFDSMGDVSPVWSPDGTRLTFRSNRANPGDIYQMDLRSSKESLLLKSPEDDAPTDWSSDGRFLLFNRFNALSGDVWVLDAEGQKPIALLESPFSERGGQFSPDGRWVAYVSNESGADEIYVRPFAIGSTGVPAVGPKWRVSTAGGVLPRWRGDGKELFFWDRSGAIAAVDVVITGASLETSVPRQLFMPSLGTVSYDVMRDGQRFLLAGLQSFQTSSPDPVTVVLNWQSAHTAREGR